MKYNVLAILFFLSCAVTTQFFCQRVQAQTTASAGMTADQAKAVKAIKIANLDKDTYFKSGGYILDRYEERPAYVFTYSDGITRKIYLYKIFAAADTKELGLLAIYQNSKTNETKSFVIPGESADRKAWDLYIDDLKYVGEKEPGLMSTLTFVLSREMASLLSGGGGKSEDGSKKKEEYNFCFAADAPVLLPNGTAKSMDAVQVGESVMAYDARTNTQIVTHVTRVDKHDGQFALTGVWVAPLNEVAADNAPTPTNPVLLEATANHPILTASGRKAMGDLSTADVLYRLENGKAVSYRVVKAEKTTRTVSTVYNLATEAGVYIVGETVVLDK